MTQQQRIGIVLSRELYAKLERLAAAEERDPWQQARWMLRRAILEAEARLPVDQVADPSRAIGGRA